MKLVVLAYSSPNNCLCKITPLEEAKKRFPDLEIDLRKMTWSWNVWWGDWKNIPIGKARNIFDRNITKYKEGIIGVYDMDNIKHVERMVNDAIEFHRPDLPLDD